MELIQFIIWSVSLKVIFFTVRIDRYYVRAGGGGAEKRGGEGMRGRLGERERGIEV